MNLHGKNDHQFVELEMNNLKSTIGISDKSNKNSFNWSDLLENPGRRAFFIGLGLAFLNQFSGCTSMLMYTGIIFKQSGSNLSSNSSTIIVGLIQLIGSFITTQLVERAGRKVLKINFIISSDFHKLFYFQILYAISTVGTALSYIIFGTYMLLKSMEYEVEEFNWVPVVSFSSIIFIATWGILTLPCVVISEIFPAKMKNFGLSFCNALIWLLAFIVSNRLPYLIRKFEFHFCAYLFSAYCLFSSVIIILFLPETKGKSYEKIMQMLH